MALVIGTNVNQYKILARLGAGGMGEVYLAEDTRLRRKVALKLLFEEVTKNEEWVRRFEQEARTASALNHPNIITIHEVGQIGESHFISAEFIEGRTLRERMREQQLTIGEALDIAIQTATALVSAHGAGIIHRDIKPENVMVRPDGYVKVLDFGLAKFSEPPARVSGSDPEADTEAIVNTNRGMVMGTVSYMSPEQIVASVSEKLGVKLTADERKKRDAESLYIKGRNAWNKRTTDGINEALRNFDQALELYPNYAPAYAGLADSYNMLATYGATSPREAFPKAHDAAIKALAIDRNLAEAHAALGYTSFRGDWNLSEAEKEFKQAIALNDSYAPAHQWYANCLTAQGRFDEAIKETRRTQELDKTSLIINAVSAYHIAAIYVGLKDKDKAFQWLERALNDRADWLVFIKVDPRFETLRSDERFQDLQRRMNVR